MDLDRCDVDDLGLAFTQHGRHRTSGVAWVGGSSVSDVRRCAEVARPPLRSRIDPDEISAEGALAGRTCALALVGTGVTLIGLSADELWHRCGQTAGRCVERAAAAGLLTLVSVFALVLGIAAWRRVRRRPVDPQGSARFVWGLGVMFSAGVALVAAKVPSFTCTRGRFDEVLVLCLHPPTTSEPASWIAAKRAILVLAVLGGALIAARPRPVKLWTVAAVSAWIGGAGWVALDGLVLHR